MLDKVFAQYGLILIFAAALIAGSALFTAAVGLTYVLTVTGGIAAAGALYIAYAAVHHYIRVWFPRYQVVETKPDGTKIFAHD